MQKKHTPIFSALNRKFLLALSLACALPAFALASTAKSEDKTAAETPQKPAFTEGTAGSYLASQFAQESGDVDAAIAYLSSALAKNPENAGLASQLLAMQVTKGDMAGATATAAKLQSLNKKDALADLLVVVSLVGKADYNAAGKKLTEAFDYANGQLWLPLVDAWIDAGKGKLKQPVTLEEMPVTVGRAAAVINYHLALINAHSGFTEQAAANFAEAADEPESAPIRVIQQIDAFTKKHPEQAALNAIVKQYKLTHNGELPALESPVASPKDGVAEVLYTMGSVMQMAGVRHDATIYTQLSRYLRPDFHLAAFTLSEILADSHDYKRANDALASIPASSQYAQKATLRQAITLDRMGKTPEALELLATLAARSPKAVEPWIARGDLLRVHDRFLEASIAYSEAINRVGDPEAKDWAVFYARGACYERLDRWSEAKADLQKSLALSPNQPDVLNYLGYGLVVRGEAIEEAKAMLEKAIAAAPNDPQIVDSMGWALYTIGEYKKALPYLEHAVELLASDATVNDHLGDVYWRLGRKNEARFQWKRALTYKPDEAEAQKINAKLSSGLPDVPPHDTKSAAASAPATPPTP